MNLQRREEISALLAAPVTGGAGQVLEYRDALMECRAHIDTLEQAAAERVIADGGRGPAVAPAVVVPETLLHDLAMAAWDEGADAGMAWDPDADPAKRGVAPCTPEEGIAKARDHFARHGSGSPGSAFSRALQAIREHSRAIPADRVLGEAKPLSSAPKDRPILAFWECPAGRLFDVVKYHNGHFVNWIELIEHRDDEEHAFPYLTREAEWIELPSFDALRANQGGAAT